MCCWMKPLSWKNEFKVTKGCAELVVSGSLRLIHSWTILWHLLTVNWHRPMHLHVLSMYHWVTSLPHVTLHGFRPLYKNIGWAVFFPCNLTFFALNLNFDGRVFTRWRVKWRWWWWWQESKRHTQLSLTSFHYWNHSRSHDLFGPTVNRSIRMLRIAASAFLQVDR